MTSLDDYYINQLNYAAAFIFKYLVPILYVVGNIGNLLSVCIFSKKFWRKNVCVFYFLVYIFFCSCYLNCTTLAGIFIYGYNITAENSNVILCKMFIYVSHLLASASPSVLILASIDRLLISSQNVDTRLYSSKRLAYFSISISTCFWVIYNLHVLVKVNIQQFSPSYYFCYYDLSKWYLDFIFYSLLSIQIFFALTLFILSMLSVKNVRHIRTVPRQRRKEVRSMTKKDFQLLRCLFAQGIVFITFSMLINIYYGYEAGTRDQIQTPLQDAIGTFVDDFLTFLYNIPYCANFFIFVSLSKAFRHDLKQLAYKMCGKNILPIREEENKQENVEPNVDVVNCVVLPN